MNLNQLYYFKVVAEVQHFRYAAELLNISQPSLSYAISTLENELGIALFEKQGRNVSLTKYGLLFLDHVKRSLDILEDGKNKIKLLTNENSGHIDIAYVAPLALNYIPTQVRNFLNQPIYKEKEITFTFKQGFTQQIIEGVKQGRYDIGFCAHVPDEHTLCFEPIYTQELVVITPPNHPLTQFQQVSFEQLAPYPLVVYARDSGMGKLTNRLLKEHIAEPRIICEGEDEIALVGLVAQNFGISLVAKTESLQYVDVAILPLSHNNILSTIYLVYMKERFMPPIISQFIEYIKDHPSIQ